VDSDEDGQMPIIPQYALCRWARPNRC
jgi:hypothetical protein